MSKFIDRTGEIEINNQGLNMKIVKYRNATDIDIEFENGYVSKNKEYRDFKIGKIKNLYYPNICRVGYTGEGNYNVQINGKSITQYNAWRNVLIRCYSQKYREKYPTYKDCTVCEEWHNFQNFAQWFDDNYYEIENEKMCLDKDILIKGNKVYNPEVCIFVSQRINKLFIRHNNDRGNFPIGVHFRNDTNKFRATINKNNNHVSLGSYNTPEKAFEVYKREKEKYIKEVADEYKEKIPQKLYNAMYIYKVEIND